MERRILGRTGLSVSVIGLGTGQFGSFGQTRAQDCIPLVHAAMDGGVNLIDTADFYSFGEAETITGEALKGRRDKVVLSTKCGHTMSNDPNERGGSRAWIRKAVEASLKRLGTDYIDIYHLHTPDALTDIEETMDAMNDLIRDGKIRYYATSNFTGQMLSEAALRAQMRGFNAPYSEQSAYSIFNRGPEGEVLPTCLKYGMGFMAYSPLDSGWLSGKYRRETTTEKTPRHRLQPGKFDLDSAANARKVEALEGLAALCEETGVPMAHMALGFVLAHRAVTVAVIGGNKLSHIEGHLKGQEVILSDEILDRIDAIAAPGLNLPVVDPAFAALSDKDMRRRRREKPEAKFDAIAYIRSVTQAPE